ALYPQAAARRLMRGGSSRLCFGTVVSNPARGVGSALPGHFTRRLPPGGSCAAEAPGCVLAPWCPTLSAALAVRSQGTLPAGCRQAAQCVAEAPGCVLAPWCPTLSAALAVRCEGTLPAGCRQAAHARREPPVVFWHRGAQSCPRRWQCVARALYPRAAALRLNACFLTSYFSLLSTSYPLLSRVAGGRPVVATSINRSQSPNFCQMMAKNRATSPLFKLIVSAVCGRGREWVDFFHTAAPVFPAAVSDRRTVVSWIASGLSHGKPRLSPPDLNCRSSVSTQKQNSHALRPFFGQRTTNSG
ncbi:MAG: hypothetical protein RLZZ436_1816, partial [Planctomycetota bacterium]